MTSSSHTIAEALNEFYRQQGLPPDGGQSDQWVQLRFGKFYIPFPNFPGRKKAVMYHDLHHIVTGYSTSWLGEAAVGAWEIASGCRDYRAAWIFDLGIFALGIFICPVTLFRAFTRGRQSINFYHRTHTYEEILAMPLDEARTFLKLDTKAPAFSFGQVFTFAIWWLFALIAAFAIYVLPVMIVIYCIRHYGMGLPY